MHATDQSAHHTQGHRCRSLGLAGVATLSVDAGGAFAHHGLLHTGADLARMAANVKAGAAPYTAGYAKTTANRHAQSGCTARPQAIAYEHGTAPPQHMAAELRDDPTAGKNLCHTARHKQRPYPLIHPMCRRRSLFHISDDV